MPEMRNYHEMTRMVDRTGNYTGHAMPCVRSFGLNEAFGGKPRYFGRVNGSKSTKKRLESSGRSHLSDRVQGIVLL